MQERTDQQLLSSVATTGDRESLNELARRHLPFVYAVARRQVRDPHLAEDVAQAVFIVLVRKAGSIRPGTTLTSWLFTVTRHAVSNARRVEQRRRLHEGRSAEMNEQAQRYVDRSFQSPTLGAGGANSGDGAELSPLLNEAIARLNETERSGVLLHFFDNKTHREVGVTLGLSEDAARKRVGRALEKMRAFLSGRGVASATSGLVVAGALSAEASATAAIAPPATLYASTVNIALIANTINAAAGGSTVAGAIAEGIAHMMTLTKIKIAASITAAALLAGGAVVPLIALASSPSRGPMAPTQVTHSLMLNTQALSALDKASSAGAADELAVKVSDTYSVKLLGVSSYPPSEDTWHSANGTAIPAPDLGGPDGQGRVHASPEPQHQVVFQITKPKDAYVRLFVPGAMIVANSTSSDDASDQLVFTCAFRLQDEAAKSAKFEIGLSEGDWTTLAANENAREEATVETATRGPLKFNPVEGEGEQSKVVLECSHGDERGGTPTQIVAIDADGNTHRPVNINDQSDGTNDRITCTFNMPAEKIQKVLFQVREISTHVDVTDVSLEKGFTTSPRMEIRPK